MAKESFLHKTVQFVKESAHTIRFLVVAIFLISQNLVQLFENSSETRLAQMVQC
jgi:hypothetical protein